MQVNAVAAPVFLEDATELREIEVDHLLDWKGVGGAIRVIAAPGTRRKRHVLHHWEVLHGSHEAAEEYSAQRVPEATNRDRAVELNDGTVACFNLGEGDIQRKGAAAQQHILQELRMRTQ